MGSWFGLMVRVHGSGSWFGVGRSGWSVLPLRGVRSGWSVLPRRPQTSAFSWGHHGVMVRVHGLGSGKPRTKPRRVGSIFRLTFRSNATPKLTERCSVQTPGRTLFCLLRTVRTRGSLPADTLEFSRLPANGREKLRRRTEVQRRRELVVVFN